MILQQCCLVGAEDEDGSFYYDMFISVCTMFILTRETTGALDRVVVLTLDFLAKYEECINKAAICSETVKEHDSDWRRMRTEINDMRTLVSRIAQHEVKEPLMKKLDDIQTKTYS